MLFGENKVKDKKFNYRKNDSYKKNDSYRNRDNGFNEEKEDNGIVVGRNAVRELLKSDRAVDKIYVRKGDREGSITVLIAEAANKNIPIIEAEPQKLDNLAEGANHQGIVALASMKEYSSIDDMLALANERNEKPLIVICDSIEDPHNLGAIIRCAECAGAHGIVIPKRRSVGITPTVYKSSAGAIEHMLIAKVSNLNSTVEELKEKGLWIYSAEAGGTPYYETDFNCGCGIILGSEGNGVSRLLKENSDFIVSIPMYGKVNSLNVSTAASVILCHAARIQRS
ncbi:MAG: 23S rRNA (guanosine(2251)-2'-O)-methyltransferase RlmB [Clostridia bacterium]|nr:23S rRNA (guanosine(2251)-2'-O)-methyltransferase RlmB [Clostridia bacterium]